ncbi:TIGR00255 family protein [Alteribacillus persepolensis]|uniref:TIGR00255 family protein n=1 Tax=Alteribacillus persepolensis TaxID=568899 RepID=A0A1G7YHT9_9BACI|nr:YicC/YloC family endoribonuclease [Alteribacillus persepolensis]SDG96131.1 TIGR00255 family protein [Alteribacillus persepolensis]
MAVSMTGFGRAVVEQDGGRILVEMKSVNHRFCDIQFRMPRQLLSLEDRFRTIILDKVERGKIDVFISMEGLTPLERTLRVDWPLVQQYLDQAEELDRLNVFESKLRLQDFLLHPDIVVIEDAEKMDETLEQAVEDAVASAAAELYDMRVREGMKLKEDIEARIEHVQQLTGMLQKEAPSVAQHYRERMYDRIKAFMGDYEPDEERLIQETAFFAEKSNVEEELTRLYSHCDQFLVSLDAGGTKGRKLDFLVQEMNREANTIGSKANNASLSHLVVELKSELEKIKEQVQNIE